MAFATHPVSIVTGAGSGIGRATALMLAARGHAVVLAGRRIEALHETAAMILRSRQDAPLLVFPCDLTDPRQARSLIDATSSGFGRIDALINNAGDALLIPIERTDPEALGRSFAVNALAPGYTIHCVWPVMQAQRSGRIINVSTRGTADPFPGFFAYAAAKSAVNVYAMSIAKEGKRFNIKGFSVAPGATETPMLRRNFSEQTIPPEQCMSADEVARTIVECAIGERDAENGATLFVIPRGM